MAKDDPTVKVAVLPGNIALMSKPFSQFPALRECERFLLKHEPCADGDVPGRPHYSVFPAGLVPRVEARLKETGCEVSVVDRRQFGPGQGFRVNKNYLRDSGGEEEAFLRAALANPLGQVQYAGWPGLTWRVAALCCLYPESRPLIVAPNEGAAADLCCELDWHLGPGVGLLARGHRKPARCQVTHRSMLKYLAREWQMLLLVVLRACDLGKSACDAVAGLQARRVYTLVPRNLRVGRCARLRLEALSGPLIDP